MGPLRSNANKSDDILQTELQHIQEFLCTRGLALEGEYWNCAKGYKWAGFTDSIAEAVTVVIYRRNADGKYTVLLNHHDMKRIDLNDSGEIDAHFNDMAKWEALHHRDGITHHTYHKESGISFYSLQKCLQLLRRELLKVTVVCPHCGGTGCDYCRTRAENILLSQFLGKGKTLLYRWELLPSDPEGDYDDSEDDWMQEEYREREELRKEFFA